MNYFLAKTDPEHYSIKDLERDGKTVWDGVRNPQAVQAIRQMKRGDIVLIYHSQGQAAVVGLAKVVSESRPDQTEPKSWVVDFQFLENLVNPVTLKEIKASGKFNDLALVRQSRLSTMLVPESFVAWVKEKGTD